MPRKRRTKKQILAAEKQAERMKRYWAKKKAEDEKTGNWNVFVLDTTQTLEQLFKKVYMAGWNKNKSPHIQHIHNQISVQDATQLAKELLETWKTN